MVTVLLALVGAIGSASGQCVMFETTPAFLRSGNDTRILATVLTSRSRDTLRPAQPAVRLRVEEADGPGANLVGSDPTAVVVRWAQIGDSCDRVLKRDSLTSGRRYVFRAILRPDSLWIDGRPTFDVPPEILAEMPSLDAYRQFLAMLPTKEEWERDCRPGVTRVLGWLGSHPDVAQHPPFTAVDRRLRPACVASLERRALGLERWKPTPQVPNELRLTLAHEGCRRGPDVMNDWDQAVDGHFVDAAAPQWAVICAMSDHWRLLVVVLGPPVKIIELARLTGNEWSWLAGAAPREYFDWTGAGEFRNRGRWGVPRPRRDLVLLTLVSEDQTLAFFETQGGWIHVGVRCCSWPE